MIMKKFLNRLEKKYKKKDLKVTYVEINLRIIRQSIQLSVYKFV